MSFDSSTNEDLVWHIGDRKYPERSVAFLKRFEEVLCLFSCSVEQLYSNYEIFTADSGYSDAIALPNPYAHHDTFNHIEADSVKKTGLYIVPTEAVNDAESKSLLLMYQSQKMRRMKSLPLKQGIEQVQQKYKKISGFLPVILNKDLQVMNGAHPIMHLHYLNLNKLNFVSDLQKMDIRKTIEHKIEVLIQH